MRALTQQLVGGGHTGLGPRGQVEAPGCGPPKPVSILSYDLGFGSSGSSDTSGLTFLGPSLPFICAAPRSCRTLSPACLCYRKQEAKASSHSGFFPDADPGTSARPPSGHQDAGATALQPRHVVPLSSGHSVSLGGCMRAAGSGGTISGAVPVRAASFSVTGALGSRGCLTPKREAPGA